MCTALTGGLGGNEHHPASPLGTWWRNKVFISPPMIRTLCFGQDTGCSLKDLPEAMDDRDEWRERVREIHASGTS